MHHWWAQPGFLKLLEKSLARRSKLPCHKLLTSCARILRRLLWQTSKRIIDVKDSRMLIRIKQAPNKQARRPHITAKFNNRPLTASSQKPLKLAQQNPQLTLIHLVGDDWVSAEKLVGNHAASSPIIHTPRIRKAGMVWRAALFAAALPAIPCRFAHWATVITRRDDSNAIRL